MKRHSRFIASGGAIALGVIVRVVKSTLDAMNCELLVILPLHPLRNSQMQTETIVHL